MTDYIPSGLLLPLGVPGSGKSTFSAQLVATGQIPAEAIVSTDAIRLELTGSAEEQAANGRVFKLRDERVLARLRAGLPVYADSTNIDGKSRRALIAMAHRFDVPVTAILFDEPLNVALSRNRKRDRVVPEDVIAKFFARLTQLSPDKLREEGVDAVVSASNRIVVLPSGVHGEYLTGPFDIVGDVHGQLDALNALVASLGYRDDWTHPEGRLLVFVGDLPDKGPQPVEVLVKVMEAHRLGRALMVKGNHENKVAKVLTRVLQASSDSMTVGSANLGKAHKALAKETKDAKFGLSITLDALRRREDFVPLANELIRWISRLPMHVVLDSGKLVVAHAAGTPELFGKSNFASGNERRQAEKWFLYGPTTGKSDPVSGYPERIDWVPNYSGDAHLVRGHVMVDEPSIVNRVVSVDTGAGDYKRLTAFSWPSMSFTSQDCDPKAALLST